MNGREQSAMTLLDRRAISSAIDGDVVPAKARFELRQSQAAADTINQLHAQAEDEVSRIRHDAFEAGLAAARQRFEAEKLARLVRFHERQKAQLQKLEGRVGELALAVLTNIAPQLNARELVAAFVKEAIDAAQAEQFLLIKVHPQLEAQAKAHLQALLTSCQTRCRFEIEADDALHPLSCTVESEVGIVKAGWTEQLKALRDALERDRSSRPSE